MMFTKIINFLLIIILYSANLYGQAVKMLLETTVKGLPEAKKFAYMEPSIDTTNCTFITRIQSHEKNHKEVIEKMYFASREKAMKMGCNGYRLNSFQRGGDHNDAYLILDCYYLSDSLLSVNFKAHEKNVIYIFGNEREGDGDCHFKLMGNEKILKAGMFYKLKPKEGETLILNKGGSLGSTLHLTYDNTQEAAFYSITGVKLSGMQKQLITPGIAFELPRFERIYNISFGYLLALLLKEVD